MPLTPEDGTGLADADVYETTTDLEARLAKTGRALTGDATAKDAAHVRAVLYVENRLGERARGDRLTAAQARLWPRSGVTIDGIDYEPNEIPRQLLDAVAEAAFIEARTPFSLTPELERGGQLLSESVTVGPISESRTYRDAAPVGVVHTAIEPLLRPLRRPAGLTRA